MTTLVEMLVAISVVGLVLAMGINSSQQARNRRIVVTAADDVRSILLAAKANAQSGKKDCGACGAVGGVCGKGDVPLDGWQVTVNASSYTVEGKCGAINFGQQFKNLPGGVTAVPNDARILFAPLGQVSGAPVTITLTGVGGVTSLITVTPEGGVQ